MHLHRIASIPSMLLVAACADDAAPSTLTLTLTDVPPLAAATVYEGWAIVDGEAVSTGRFTVDDDGAAVPPSSTLPAALDAVSRLVITIEPAVADDPAPSATHLLAGDVDGATVALTAAHEAALGTDFAGAAGSFVLATPSTADDTSENGQGIWWLVPGEPATPSLTLPALPAGWSDEGWVAGDDGPVTTGRFTAVDAADADGAGPTAGPDGAPPFPGQDYIAPPLVLNGGDVAAVITVEPEPDDAATPFPIKPLVLDPIAAATAPTSHAMVNVAADSLPSATATIE